jgi:hypothetical protein
MALEDCIYWGLFYILEGKEYFKKGSYGAIGIFEPNNFNNKNQIVNYEW